MTLDEFMARHASLTNTFDDWYALLTHPRFRYHGMNQHGRVALAEMLLCVTGTGYVWRDGYIQCEDLDARYYVRVDDEEGNAEAAEMVRMFADVRSIHGKRRDGHYPLWGYSNIVLMAADSSAHLSYLAVAREVCENIIANAQYETAYNLEFATNFVKRAL